MPERTFTTEERTLEHEGKSFSVFVDKPIGPVHRGRGVLMLHGGLDDESQPAQAQIRDELIAKGITVMRVRLPYINKHETPKDREFAPFSKLLPFAKKAIADFREKEKITQLGLCGHSMGANLAWRAHAADPTITYTLGLAPVKGFETSYPYQTAKRTGNWNEFRIFGQTLPITQQAWDELAEDIEPLLDKIGPTHYYALQGLRDRVVEGHMMYGEGGVPIAYRENVELVHPLDHALLNMKPEGVRFLAQKLALGMDGGGQDYLYDNPHAKTIDGQLDLVREKLTHSNPVRILVVDQNGRGTGVMAKAYLQKYFGAHKMGGRLDVFTSGMERGAPGAQPEITTLLKHEFPWVEKKPADPSLFWGATAPRDYDLVLFTDPADLANARSKFKHIGRLPGLHMIDEHARVKFLTLHTAAGLDRGGARSVRQVWYSKERLKYSRGKGDPAIALAYERTRKQVAGLCERIVKRLAPENGNGAGARAA